MQQDLQILTLQQAAFKTGKSEKTLRTWIKKNKLKATFNGRNYEIKLEDINAVINTSEWSNATKLDEMQDRIIALELNQMDCTHAIEDLQKAVKKLQPKRTPTKRTKTS